MSGEPWRLLHGEPPEIGAEDAHVWSASLDLNGSTVHRLEGVLSPDERERAERFSIAIPRRRYVAARGILRTILSRYVGADPAGIILGYGDHGKPFIPAPWNPSGIQFNVSHAADLALIAVTKGRGVGIDVEAITSRAYREAIVRRFFSPREQDVLRSLPGTERDAQFIVFWTRKEACIKASGLGLSLPLASFDVSSNARGPRAIVSGGEASRIWTVDDIGIPRGYAAACAVDGVGLRIVRLQLRL